MITGPQARELGLKIVLETPGGIGPTEIGKKILVLHPDMVNNKGRPSGTIRGAVWDLDRKFPALVKKSANGFAPIEGASLPEEISCRNPKTAGATSAVSAKPSRTNAGSAGTSSVTTAATAPTQPSSDASGASRANRTTVIDHSAPPRNLRDREKAAEDAVAQAHGNISELESLLSKATLELQSERRVRREAGANIEPGSAHQGVPDRIGVISEAQDTSILVDIRQAVLAGSEEGTLDAVRRVVDDLARVKTQLALTGIRDDAKRLKAARKAAGVLQRTLGNKLGYTGRSVIDLIERGMVPLSKHPKVLSWVQKVEAKYADPVRH